MSLTIQGRVLQDLLELLEPIASAAREEDGPNRLLRAVGWEVEFIADFPEVELRSAVEAFESAYTALTATEDLDTLAAFGKLLVGIGEAVEAVQAIKSLADRADGTRPEGFEQVVHDLFGLLFANYLREKRRFLYALGVLLTLIEERELPGLDEDGQLVRVPTSAPLLRLERLPALIRDPVGKLKEEYGLTSGLQDPNGTADKLFPRLAEVLTSLGIDAIYGLDPLHPQDYGTEGNTIAAHTLTIRVPLVSAVNASGKIGLGIVLDEELGIVFLPFGEGRFSETFERWRFTLSSTLAAEGFALSSEGLLLPENGGTSVGLKLEGRRLPAVSPAVGQAPGPAIIVGGPGETRLELGVLRVVVDARLEGTERSYGIMLETESSALFVDAGGDGFLGKILPATPQRIDFEAALRWSSKDGLHFRGSGGLEATLAAQVELGGVVKVRAIHLAVLASTGGGDLRLQASASVAVQLGPVGLTADRVGLEAIVDFSAAERNLELFNLGFGFKFPNGVEISIDAGPVAGGGFLRFDAEAGRYSGALSLRIYEIDVSAFGIIDTNLPDGSRGFSFAILISARFTPIQLGFGFTLNGVGGMLGINRTVDTARLQDAVRRHTLDHVLFPQEPEKNALAILNDLGAFFPPVEGRYTFGPMALIGWGNVAGESGRVFILEAELGIILELPEPIRLTVLGQVKVGLPSLEKRFVKLNFDVVGVLEFTKKAFSLDASLYDSEVGGFTVSGDMALRLNWGDPPNFALAIGGFHPLYRAPAGFPSLRRVTVDLSNIGNPRLTLTGYLALTSNTFQVGAKAELLASKGSFNIYGWIGFDALFTFQPFTFRADFRAGVALRKGTRHWASIHVSGTLSGPNPWHVQGEACLSLFFFDICVGFKLDLSRRSAEPILPLPNILDKLAEELSSPRNWSAEAPPAAHQVVSLVQADGPDNRPLLDPLGAAVVKERLLPLNQKIDRFEHGKLGKKDPNKFFISKITLRPGTSGATEITPIPVVRDYFARGQFQDMSDAAKLSLPAFELMNAGTRIGSDRLQAGGIQSCSTQYKTLIIDGPAEESETDGYSPSPDLTARLARRSALALGGLRASGPEKFFGGVGTVVKTSLGVEPFTIATVAGLVSRDDLLAVPEERLGFVTKGKVYDILAEHLDANPGDHGRLQVVPRLELPTAAPT